ncbi:hypothetical protein [Haloarcula amylovorans]|uniref:hypothetical protein n=1 Tax=Haloarcula amylovorans TaxID=2562280 RepID=UPI001431FD93|nr:hypothetical protein [Halomicroarcula amylolytica]
MTPTGRVERLDPHDPLALPWVVVRRTLGRHRPRRPPGGPVDAATVGEDTV